VPHRIVTVTDTEAVETARALARSEGIFLRHLLGRDVCRSGQGRRRGSPGRGDSRHAPDTAERYLSTVLFEGIAEGGDPEP